MRLQLLVFLMVLMVNCNAVVYYISPDPIANETCTVNGNTTLTPCFSIQQLCEDETLLSNKTELTLLLLSGIHILGQNLSASNTGQLEISPWTGQQEVEIKCEWQASLHFIKIRELELLSVKFFSCNLRCTNFRHLQRNIIFVTNCVFAKSKGHAIIINKQFVQLKLNVSLNNCTFYSNNGAVLCSSNYSGIGTHYKITLHVTDTTFLSNWRHDSGGAMHIINVDFKLKRSRFILNIAKSGGAIFLHHSTVCIENTIFQGNQAIGLESGRGGAIYCPKQSSLYNNIIEGMGITLENTSFIENVANKSGGAISCAGGMKVRILHCRFKLNVAGDGGAIDYFSQNANVNGELLELKDSEFEDNSAVTVGGAISCNIDVIVLLNSRFKRNTAGNGGALYCTRALHVRMTNDTFYENSATYGGAIWVEELHRHIILIHCHFHNNSAEIAGGAAYMFSYGNIRRFAVHIQDSFAITGNKAAYGGAIYAENVTLEMESADAVISENIATVDGGAIYLINSSIMTLYDTIMTVVYNSAWCKGGGFFLEKSSLSISFHSLFNQNKAGLYGGAIAAVSSVIQIMIADVSMTNNIAENKGGAMFLNYSHVITDGQSHIKFTHNIVTSTTGKGGAIFVLDNNGCEAITYLHTGCFLEVRSKNSTLLEFTNNRAVYGSMVYGGLLDRCYPSEENPHLLGIDSLNLNQRKKLDISSDPIKLCFCLNATYTNCTQREATITRIRGQTANLLISSVDQDENPLTSIISANYKEEFAGLGKGEGSQTIPSKCSNIHYHIFTTYTSATLVLGPAGICERSILSRLTVHITVLPCVKGFEQKNDTCICERRLIKFNVHCDINTLAIQKERSLWLRYDEKYLMIHTNCPLDYCNATDTISLSSANELCANHRSGVICGACQGNHSIALGSSKCLRCTSRYTSIWLTVVFAVAGVALVALLLVCNMTISTGTLNGLIFYANVVSISGLTNLQNCSIHPILSVFIAWLNLDFGVETCFYPGMDTYHKTWLQLAFPLYIWLLVVAIIVASYYSSRAMRVFGRNNVAILATLFLLSYSKILKTIITALSATEVLVGSAENTSSQLVPNKVWTYDGNIEYLKGKHVALFTVALLLLLLLFLPYTLLLMFGQCVRSMSVRRRCVLGWIRSTAFISIMDAYHAPYHRRHRYWTGFLLLTRCVLFLAFAASYRDSDILVNMYITNLVISGVLVVKTFTTRVYKNFHMSVLELCFLVNLEVLSATLYYLKGRSNSYISICKCTSASISISFLLFIGIIAYHLYLQIRKRKWYSAVKLVLLNKLPLRQHHDNVPVEDTHATNFCTKKLPTTTSVELREELLQ